MSSKNPNEEWTEDQQNQIEIAVVGLHDTIEHNRIPLNIAASALMVLSSNYAIASLETDEYLLEQYRLCLANARKRQAEMAVKQ